MDDKDLIGHGQLGRDNCVALAMSCADYNLRRANRVVTQVFDQALKPSGLKITQFSLLVAAFFQSNLVLSKLARAMAMDRTTLSRNLKLLEQKGLVTLERGEDRREVRVLLTKAGRKSLDVAYPLWQKAQDRVTGVLGDEQWNAMLAGLRTVVRELRK